MLLSSSPPQANADQLLIARTCNRSENIQYCQTCFNSSQAIHRDLRALGSLAIHCAWSQVETMRGIWDDCYRNKEGDERARCDYCIHQFGNAEHYVLHSTYMWQQSRYVDCLEMLKLAADHVFNCRYSYRDVGEDDDERKYMKQAGDTTGYLYAASGVIRQLLPNYIPN
ncbi:hypothetical protein LINGRAPRIM_LOCUS3115 [Linum grandiflorum]